jgi:hypothetical protein
MATRQYLEELPQRDVPPPNKHIFWKDTPASKIRPYGAHAYFSTGRYQDGPGIWVYWKTKDSCWYRLNQDRETTCPHWGTPYPEANVHNYLSGEVPEDFVFEDYSRNDSSDSESSNSMTTDPLNNSPERPDYTSP